ncbi:MULTISPECIES: hypothetical protein [Shewanella]|uniref:hypothetical protein n=1 Tax=Shewanella TaxID=22 RepID=UPI000B49C236|nr:MULTISPECIES: hypothetical protein [unclassified Shewanella]
MNFNKFLVISCLIASVLVPTLVSADEYQYIYKSWSSDLERDIVADSFNVASQNFTIDTKSKVLFWGHAGSPYDSCDDNWICIESITFNFAIQKKDKTAAEWKHKGFKYINKGKETIEFFGISQEVFKIQVINLSREMATSDPMIVYYSSTNGILGFTQLLYDVESEIQYPVTYWSTENLGFGSR